ncbi:MAG: TIGR00366 family protein [Paracoccus sp. (in: a-proteobacteria)]
MLQINAVMCCLVFAGIGLHGNLRDYLLQLGRAIKNTSGTVIQFPFYAGLMGLMGLKAQSELASDIASLAVTLNRMRC